MAIIYLDGSEGQGGIRGHVGKSEVKVAERLSGNGAGYTKDASGLRPGNFQERKREKERERRTVGLPHDDKGREGGSDCNSRSQRSSK